MGNIIYFKDIYTCHHKHDKYCFPDWSDEYIEIELQMQCKCMDRFCIHHGWAPGCNGDIPCNACIIKPLKCYKISYNLEGEFEFYEFKFNICTIPTNEFISTFDYKGIDILNNEPLYSGFICCKCNIQCIYELDDIPCNIETIPLPKHFNICYDCYQSDKINIFSHIGGHDTFNIQPDDILDFLVYDIDNISNYLHGIIIK
jgi:hypothetical protein